MLSFKGILKVCFSFIGKNIGLILLGTFLGIGLFVIKDFAGRALKKIIPRNTTVGILGKYSLETLPPEVGSMISFGLTKLSSNSTPEPGAASSWDIEEQGKKYVFHLDKNLSWHDGSPLTAKDIKYEIKGVTATILDDNTIIYELKDEFSPLPALLAKPLFKKGKLGLGDYKIRKIWYNAGNISTLKIQKINNTDEKEQITYLFYPDEMSLANAFKLGEIDCMFGMSTLQPLEEWKNITVSPKQETDKRYAALYFNTAKEPLSDKRLRQALSYAVRKTNKQNRAISPISPSSWAYNDSVKTYAFEPDHALTILKDAQITDSDQISLEIVTTNDLVDTAESIRLDWENILNIKTEVRVVPIISNLDDFDVILTYGSIPPDPDQYYFWHSGQPGNISKYSNPRIDKILEDGRKTFSKEERKILYQDFQRYLLEDVPALFLFYPETYNVCRQNSSQNLNPQLPL